MASSLVRKYFRACVFIALSLLSGEFSFGHMHQGSHSLTCHIGSILALDSLRISCFLSPLCRIRLALDQLTNDLIAVVLTGLVEGVEGAHCLPLTMLHDHVCPGIALQKGMSIADDEQKVAWTRDGHIQSSNICQEA